MTQNTHFWKTFSRRSAICYLIIVSLFLSCILRVAVTATTNYSAVLESQNSLKIKIANLRGTIFDCNMVPLTNNSKKIIAAVSPTPRAVTAISSVLKGEELENVLQRLQKGKPVLCEVPKTISCDGIVCTEIYENSNEQIATHLLGYVNIDGKGVSGIQSAYDNILRSEKEAYVSYECNGKGSILEGLEPKLKNDTSVRASGVVSTIDTNIQSIAEICANSIEEGAILVADAENGKLRACVSRPTFDINNIEDYLSASNSPLLNRALNAYNVGSVFKPCVAIAGIENNKIGYCYTCTGKCKIIDRYFKCHKYDGHGFMDLRLGLANSCNTYFYNYAFQIGKNNILKTASTLKFGNSLKLCEGINTADGNLPETKSLDNIAYLANFSIGQGELLLSPVSMLTLYSSIASNGSYYIPSIVEGTLQNGKLEKYDIGKPTRVMKSETAAILRQYLASVLTEGTGEDAIPLTVTAAGKTATAQTGKYENNIEICRGWFCGFFPSEDPKYVVVVFSEDINKQEKSCAQIFAEIADHVTALNN